VRGGILAYGGLILILFTVRFIPQVSFLPYLYMSFPLLFNDLKEVGFRNYREGLRWGWFLIPLVVIFPPLSAGVVWVLNQLAIALIEEVFFRGYLMRYFGNVRTSLLFAIAHLINFPTINSVLVFFPSLLFGYSYIKSKSILAPFLLHLCANLFYYSFSEKALDFYHLFKPYLPGG